MSVFRLGFVLVVAMLAAGGHAHAQTVNPLTYWTPGWPVGFSGDPGANTYGNFPSFDTRDSRASAPAAIISATVSLSATRAPSPSA
jgi:hypothetical protein